MDLRAGIRIDHYTLIAPLGSGGQGSVWKVLDPRDGGVERAVKLVSVAQVGPAGIERAQREARILATSHHPSLVTCHGFFEDPRAGIVGLVMDLVPGRTLGELASLGLLSGEHVFAALSQIADALAYIHHAGLAHRDLKPENVIVTDAFLADPSRPEAIKLVDFGIAAPTGSARALTATGLVIGTLPYLAPEVVDPASWGRAGGPARDVFALGVMGHQLLTGKHPTRLGPSASLIDYARAYKAAEAKRIPWPPALSGGLGAATAACLALRAADRPRDGAAVVELLRTGAAPEREAWSGASGPTSPHVAVTEPAAPRSVARTAPMTTPRAVDRTVPAAPLRAAMSMRPEPRKRGCTLTMTVVVALIAAGALAATYLPDLFRAPVVAPTHEPREAPSPPREAPAPSPPPLVDSSGSCCPPDHGACSPDRHPSYACRPCVGQRPNLPRRTSWKLRVASIARGSSDIRAVHPGAVLKLRLGSQERTLSLDELPTRQPVLSVTTEDLEGARMEITLQRGGETLLVGSPHVDPAKGTHIKASSLCAGLLLQVEDPPGAPYVIGFFLDP